MPGVSIEFILMLGYAVLLGAVALLLEFAARHAHRRSLSISTTGFTYHADKDMWKCREFPAGLRDGAWAGLLLSISR